jgi:hypothetical protein
MSETKMKPVRKACEDVINAFKNEACWGNKRLEHPDATQRNKYKRKMLKGMCLAAGVLTREREARLVAAFPDTTQKEMLKGIVEAMIHGLPDPDSANTMSTIATAAMDKAGIASAAPTPMLMVERPHLHRREDEPGVLAKIFKEYGDAVCKDLAPTAAFPGWTDETMKELLCEVIGACRVQLWFHFKDGKSHIDAELAKILSSKSTPDKQATAFSRYLKSLKAKSEDAQAGSVAAGGGGGGGRAVAPKPNPKPQMDCKFFLEGKCKHGDSCTYAHNPDALVAHKASATATKSSHKAKSTPAETECHFHFTEGKSCKHGPDGLKEIEGKTCAFSHKRIVKPKADKPAPVLDAEGFVQNDKGKGKGWGKGQSKDKSESTTARTANPFATLASSHSTHDSDHDADTESDTSSDKGIAAPKSPRKPAPLPKGLQLMKGKRNWADSDSEDEA